MLKNYPQIACYFRCTNQCVNENYSTVNQRLANKLTYFFLPEIKKKFRQLILGLWVDPYYGILFGQFIQNTYSTLFTWG